MITKLWHCTAQKVGFSLYTKGPSIKNVVKTTHTVGRYFTQNIELPQNFWKKFNIFINILQKYFLEVPLSLQNSCELGQFYFIQRGKENIFGGIICVLYILFLIRFPLEIIRFDITRVSSSCKKSMPLKIRI